MRTFADKHGERWQAALLDASYGNIVLVYSPVHGDTIRQQLLDVDNLSEGQARLDGLDDDTLRAMLADADIWDANA